MSRSLARLLCAATAACVVAGWAPGAGALSVTGVAVATTAANSANLLTTTGANRIQITSTAGLVGSVPAPVADVVGSSLAFDARYAALLAADREANGGSYTQSATASYTITFTVDNPLGGAFQVDVDTSRIGALTLVADGSGSASAALNAVTGSLDGVPDPALGLAAVAPLAGTVSANQPFAQSSSFSFVGSGPSQTYTLRFDWTASATSGRLESAVRLGSVGTLGTTTADDYPGVGGRSAAADGHHVQVSVTLLSVPEPRTLALLASGLTGLAVLGNGRGRTA